MTAHAVPSRALRERVDHDPPTEDSRIETFRRVGYSQDATQEALIATAKARNRVRLGRVVSDLVERVRPLFDQFPDGKWSSFDARANGVMPQLRRIAADTSAKLQSEASAEILATRRQAYLRAINATAVGIESMGGVVSRADDPAAVVADERTGVWVNTPCEESVAGFQIQTLDADEWVRRKLVESVREEPKPSGTFEEPPVTADHRRMSARVILLDDEGDIILIEEDDPNAVSTPMLEAYDPNQKRDEDGKWTSGGGSARTDTPEFKAWFGKSKVVGTRSWRPDFQKPKVVYHGTAGHFTGADFEEFHYGETNDQDSGIGLFFTENAGTANWFTEKPSFGMSTTGETSPGSAVVPAYLSIENPKVYEDQKAYWAAIADTSYDRDGSGVALRKELSSAGYDGIQIESADFAPDAIGEKWWIAFEPNQIKSIFNRGTWGNGTKISESLREHEPGGKSHDQKTHGRRSIGSSEHDGLKQGSFDVSVVVEDEGDGKKWEQRARDAWGTTESPSGAGYILANGDLLDMSGANEGGTPGQRAYDHRQVSMFMDDDDYANDPQSSTTKVMWRWQKATGAIRMHKGSDEWNISTLTPMTQEQQDRLTQLTDDYGGKVYWDVYDPDGGTLDADVGGRANALLFRRINAAFK